MDYEKAYKEALERAKSMMALPDDKATMEYIFPELAESKDERINEEIRNFLIDMECKREWIAYLEKQKVNTEGDFARGYDCGYECCLNSHGAEYLEDQKEQPADAKSERVIKAARRVLNNWLDGTDCPDVSGDFAELEYAIREYDGEEKQKPTEKQDYSGLTDFERAIHRGFLCAGVENVPVEIIKETAQDCLAHIISFELPKDEAYAMMNKPPQIPEKPTEWSEEDERIRLACIATINDVIDYERDRWEDYNSGKPYRPITKYDEQIDWLKSLRPQSHWKPSYVQMGSLRLAIDSAKKAQMNATADNLNEIYEQLKKL